METSTSTILPPEAAGTPALTGDLAVLPLAELLQFLNINGRDGVLVISDTAGKPRAVIFYRQSAIIHATCDGIVGCDAVYAAMTHQTGHFEFIPGNLARPIYTIKTSVQNLILEGLRRLDELSHMTSLLPPDDRALYLAPEPPQDDIRLTAREWHFLSLVNGNRTVRQIIDVCAREEADARATLIGLLTADLIVDHRDDGYLDRIIPRTLKQQEAGMTRYAPPTLLGNLVLKSCDGKRTLRQLIESLAVDEKQFLEELRLLARTRWVAFVSGDTDFQRWIEA